MKITHFILMAIFAGIFAVVGIFVLLWGIRDSQAAIKSAQWPYVTGRMITSYVSETSDDDGTMFSARIRYTYVVNERQYTGTRVGHGDFSTSDPSDAETVVSRYPAEEDVRVYYDPSNPAQAVLETGFSAGLFLPLGLGTVFTLVGGLMLIGFTTMFIRSRSQSD